VTAAVADRRAGAAMSEDRRRIGTFLAVAGAALAAAGTFDTWFTITIAGVTAPGASAPGWDGRDGRTVVAGAAVAGIAAALVATGRTRLAVKVALLVAGAVTAIVAFAAITDTSGKAGKVEEEFGIPAGRVEATTEAGVWAVLLGGMLELTAGVVLRVGDVADERGRAAVATRPGPPGGGPGSAPAR
jgi:hypothetical protein